MPDTKEPVFSSRFGHAIFPVSSSKEKLAYLSMAVVPQRILMSWMAVAWPPVAMLILATLIVISHISALASGKCDRGSLDNGSFATAYVTEISLTTEVPPESYIWTLGVAVTWICFLCPTMALLHDMLWQAKRNIVHAIFLGLSEVLFLVATLALLGLATITNRGTILEDAHKIPDGHDIHHHFANTFFLASYFQGGSFLISQCFRWKAATPLERRSFRWKVLVLFLVALSVSGLIPLLLITILPPLHATPEIRNLNYRGLTQRLVVLGMMIFTASYALDIKALQNRSKNTSESEV